MVRQLFNGGTARAPGVCRPGSRRFWAAAFLLLVAAMLTGGCGLKCVDLESSTEKLDDAILNSGKPVLVDFWKVGCLSCATLDPVMDKLADEYRGRVVVARFCAVHFWLTPTNREVYNRYAFSFFPTAILFVDGKERDRWVWNTDLDAYRGVLDLLVGSPTTQPDSPAATALTPKTQPK